MDSNLAARTVMGRDLAAERVRAGLTQKALGQLLGVSGRRIANIESEYKPNPISVDRILSAIAEVMALGTRDT